MECQMMRTPVLGGAKRRPSSPVASTPSTGTSTKRNSTPVAQSAFLLSPKGEADGRASTAAMRVLTVFDWDDTFLPTTILRDCCRAVEPAEAVWSALRPAEAGGCALDGPEIDEALQAEFAALAQVAAETLRVAQEHGDVRLITNGSTDWIRSSCLKYLPTLWPCVRRFKRTSAKEFAGLNSRDPAEWKRKTFCSELNEYFRPAVASPLAAPRQASSRQLLATALAPGAPLGERMWAERAGTQSSSISSSSANGQSGGGVPTRAQANVVVSVGDSFHERRALYYFQRTTRVPNVCVRSVKFVPLPDCAKLIAQHCALARHLPSVLGLTPLCRSVDLRYFFLASHEDVHQRMKDIMLKDADSEDQQQGGEAPCALAHSQLAGALSNKEEFELMLLHLYRKFVAYEHLPPVDDPDPVDASAFDGKKASFANFCSRLFKKMLGAEADRANPFGLSPEHRRVCRTKLALRLTDGNPFLVVFSDGLLFAPATPPTRSPTFTGHDPRDDDDDDEDD